MIANFLTSPSGSPSKIERLKARLMAANEEILSLRGKVEELDQSWQILEMKEAEYDYLCQSLEEVDKKIELMEARASESKYCTTTFLRRLSRLGKLLRLPALS